MLNLEVVKDLADLARAGYKPSDVKELMMLNKTQETSTSEMQPQLPQQDIEHVNNVSQSIEFNAFPDVKIAEKSTETASKENAQPDDAPDYKALYEAEKQKVNDLQIKNTQADISQHQPTEADLVELVKSFC